MHLPIHLIHTIIERKLLSQSKNPAEEFLLIQVKVCEVCEKDKVLRDIKKSQLSDPERELNGCLLSFFLLLVHNCHKLSNVVFKMPKRVYFELLTLFF